MSIPLDLSLHHYTDSDGLLGILGKPNSPAEIWLSQIQYMNDHKEWWHAFEFLSNTFRKLITDSRPIVREFAESWCRGLDPKDTVFNRSGPFQRTFVFSLSEVPDLLSQWRGYTPDGGYCIEFRQSALESIAKSNGFRMVKCIYEDDEKEVIVKDFFESLIQDLLNGYISQEIKEKNFESRQSVISSAWVKMQKQTAKFACYFKHASFSEEKEWRLYGVVPAGGKDSRERWRTKGDLILPYCALTLPDLVNNEPVINSVMVGPGVDFKLAEHSIKYVIYGRLKHLTVTHSLSTLRR